MKPPLLALDGVSAHYGAMCVLDNVTLEVRRGELLGLIGPNGAGKSTLLAVVTGSKRVSSGTVLLNGIDISRVPTHRLVREGICTTSQTPRPFANMTVLENVDVAMRFGRPSRRIEPERALELAGLHRRGSEPAERLRPSELRRLELARALATDPTVLLVDEIAAGMPTSEVPALVDTLRAIVANGTAVLLVEHVMDVVMKAADRLVVLDYGAVIAGGTPSEVRRNEAVIAAYFGGSL